MIIIIIGDTVNAEIDGIWVRAKVNRILPLPKLEVITEENSMQIIQITSVVTVKRNGTVYGSAAYCPQCGEQHPDRKRWPIEPAEGKFCYKCTAMELVHSSTQTQKDN